MSGIIVRLDTGATEVEIQAALNSLPSGSTLLLPTDAVIRVTTGIKVNGSKDIILDLNGATLQQAGDASVLSISGKLTSGANASIGHNIVGQYTVTYEGANNASLGDYVKIYSDDVLPNDQGAVTRLGQAMKVIAINGSTVTLEGDLLYDDLYKTNVRAAQYISGSVEVKNGTVRGEQSHPEWQNALVSVRSTVATHMDNMTVRDGNSMGFNFVNTVNGLVTQSAAINLTDDTPNGHYGYGVHSASSLGTVVNGLYAEKVRHAVDDNAVGISSTQVDPSKYGADIALTATNVVVNSATSFAFSWHSEGRYGSYSDSVVFHSFGVVGARGTDNIVSNVSGAGNGRGLLFFEYGDGDGTRITMDNINLKETGRYGVYVQNNPTANLLSNSKIEVSSTGTTLKSSTSNLTMINTTVTTGSTILDETVEGTGAHDRLVGGKGIDVISGGGGNDYIWGGQGPDVLTGGTGHNRFVYLATSESGDSVTDFKAGATGDVIDLAALSRSLGWTGDLFAKGYVYFAQSGADTLVQIDGNGGGNDYTTLATLENVITSAMTVDNISTAIIVSDYDNVFFGTAGDNSFTYDPTLRFDYFDGGAGVDTIVAVMDAGALVSAQDGLAVLDIEGDGTADLFAIDVEHLVLSGSAIAFSASMTGTGLVDATLTGTSGADRLDGARAGLGLQLHGGAGDDTLTGGSGSDLLDGGAGDDRQVGGAGNDIYVVDSVADVVGEAVGGGTDTVHTSLSNYTLGANVENLTYTGGKALTGSGNAFDNVLVGGSGADRLDGLVGADLMVGGASNDTYVVENAGDLIVELAGQGNDRVLAQISYALADNVETLQLTTSKSINGTGNALANTIIGNAGANVLDGLGGADNLIGGSGDDVFVFHRGEANGDMIQDFSGAMALGGDLLKFVGYGTGAFVTHDAVSDSYIVYAGSEYGFASETIQLAGVTNLGLGDSFFA